MNDILVRLQPIFRDVFDNQHLVITGESSAANVEGWDSLAHMTLVSSIEQALGVRFALGELEELKNVGEMVELIERKLARGA